MSGLSFGITVVLSCLFFDVGLGKCPCTDVKLCEPITTQRKVEVFVFSNSKMNFWPEYDWTKVTTIVEFGPYNPALLCYAHSKGAKVVNMVDYPTNALTNITARAEWVTTEVNYVRDNYLDGVNVDFEGSIHQDQTDLRNGLTMLMQELSEAMKKEFKHSQITYDVPFRPTAYDRWFDYTGIAKACDFIVVMDYDMWWNVSGNRAHSNSDLTGIQYGVKQYMKQGIPANKITLALPWYGYNFPCHSYTQGNTCVTESVPFQGVECSHVGALQDVKCNDLGASQIVYIDIVEKLLPQSTTGLLWDDVSKSPYFTYKDSTTKQLHQVWFDNPKSLSIKYDYAISAGLRGVGMWTADFLDYSDTTEGQTQRKEMWGVLPRVN